MKNYNISKVTNTKNRLKEVQKQIEGLARIESEYSQVGQKLEDIETSINVLLKNLEEKNSEIQRLEGFSIGSAIKSIFVDKNKVLETKRNEYYALSKKYDKLKLEKVGMDFEFKILKGKLNKLTEYKKELEYLIELRAKELLNENSSQGHSLQNIIKDFEEEKQFLKLINITTAILDKVLNRLTLLSASYREVESYTSWKRSRNRNYAFDKRQAIKRAKELNLESKLLLSKLEMSLRDIGYTFRPLDLQLVSFENVIGMFFDNIISDFILKQNLYKAVEEVDSVYRAIKKIKMDILRLFTKSENNMQRLSEVRTSIILNN